MISKITITYSCAEYSFTETIQGRDLDDLLEHFEECRTNGSNNYLTSFENFVRPVELCLEDIELFNERDDNHHMIFGHYESLQQSYNCPHFLWSNKNTDKVKVKVETVTVKEIST